MAKKFIILGVVLFLGGAAGLGWLALDNHISQGEAASDKPESEPVAKQYLKQYKRYFQSTLEEQVDSAPGIDGYVKLKTESQRRQEQQERLNADLQDLAAGERYNHRSGDLLYGENWKQKVTKYKARKELTELIFSVSSATLLAGLALVIGCFLLRLISKISSHLKKRPADASEQVDENSSVETAVSQEKNAEETPDGCDEAIDSESDNSEEIKETSKEQPIPASAGKNLPPQQQGQRIWNIIHKRPGLETQQDANSPIYPASQTGPERNHPSWAVQNQVSDADRNKGRGSPGRKGRQETVSKHAKKTKKLIERDSHEDSSKLMEPSLPHPDADVKEAAVACCVPAATECEKNNDTEPGNFEQQTGRYETENVKQKKPRGKAADATKLEEAAIDKTVEEKVTRLAENVRQATLQDTKHLNGTLKQLSQQVSAIREYAAEQQQRVRKLQDGYDWNILKNFCLRVIHCIDHLDSRINRLSEQDVDTEHLKEIRDELVFSLESSGVEQFEAEIHSDYHGQEKRLETVKDKQPCDDPALAGKIAEVVRPGYQYVIDENNIKIVRAAQVRLLG